MEYKIFGRGGTPNAEFLQGLRAFLKLDEAQKNTISEVFNSQDFDAYDPSVPAVIVASSLLPEQFSETVSSIRYLLFCWREYELQLTDIERDLLLLGYAQGEIDALIKFLERLSNVKERVWAKFYSRVHRLDGLPTIDDLNFVCDARAVFGGFADGSDKLPPSYKKLLGITPIIIMEIISSDNYDRRQRASFQMTEEQFNWFRTAMSRAQEQLAILKERLAADVKSLP